MKHDITHNRSRHKPKEEECCDKIIDSLFWFFGYMDGFLMSYFIDCFSKDYFSNEHANSAVTGFLYGYEEGDDVYEHGVFHH